MSSLREQCDFMSNVVRRAIIMGMDHKQFVKLAETAWLVLTAEPASTQETPAARNCTCGVAEGWPHDMTCQKRELSEPPEKTWDCICGRSNYVTSTRCYYCEFQRATPRTIPE
jgi:hypothetical protein